MYVLVSQDRPLGEVFERQSDDSWLYRAAHGIEVHLQIPSIEVEVPIKAIYDGVEFPKEPSDPRPR